MKQFYVPIECNSSITIEENCAAILTIPGRKQYVILPNIPCDVSTLTRKKR